MLRATWVGTDGVQVDITVNIADYAGFDEAWTEFNRQVQEAANEHPPA